MHLKQLSLRLWLVGLLVGCGSAKGGEAADAPALDGGTDATLDAASCQPIRLLTGGGDVGTQGWTTVQQAPATVTYGADYVRLMTSTVAGAKTGGQLLLSYPAALATAKPFKLEVVMQVESVSPHNFADSAAAILGSFTPPFGTVMIYLDSGALGWADGTQAFTASVADGAYHTYELSVDAGNVARLTFDGVAALTRTGFQWNGTIALGDQTNDPNVDGVVRVRSVTRRCP